MKVWMNEWMNEGRNVWFYFTSMDKVKGYDKQKQKQIKKQIKREIYIWNERREES